jgi:hypothetical protein
VDTWIGDDGLHLAYRWQRALTRNLTAPEFLGQRLAANKTLIWDTYDHSSSRPVYPRQDATFRPALHLAQDFAPTRGRVFSILLHTLGYEFQPEDLNPAMRELGSRDPFLQRLLRELEQASTEGWLEWGKPYAVEPASPTGPLERLLARQPCLATSQHPCRLVETRWPELLSVASSADPDDYQAAKSSRRLLAGHDAVLVLRSSRLLEAE